MRFSLLQLLLVFPAYALALFLGILADHGLRISYRYFGAVNGVRDVKLSILGSEEFRDGQRIPSDVLDRWLAGSNLTTTEKKQHCLYEYPELDPWRRPYRFIRDERLPNGQFVELGVYSLGRNGLSKTNGNDPDDINSWDERSSDIYAREIDEERRLFYARRGAYLTPFVYVALLAAAWLFRRLRRSQPNRVPATVEIVLLWAAIVATLAVFWKRSRWAATCRFGMGQFRGGVERGDLADELVTPDSD